MDALIAIVIIFFVVVGVYVGYHASQVVPEEGEGHNITIELEILNENSGTVQILQNPEFEKIIR